MSSPRSFMWMVLAACTVAAPAQAKPAHLKSLQEHYGKFLGARLVSCGTCHQASAPGKDAETLAAFPHNAFGDRLHKAGEELSASGRRADIAEGLRMVAAEDADGDRVPNELELLSNRRPGDSKDRPGAAELAQAQNRVPKFRAFLAAYRWRPFEPVRRPQVPKVKNAAWVRTPVDAFLAAEHEKRGLKPRPEASRETLIRRLYLDLI